MDISIIERKGKKFVDVTEQDLENCPECGHVITDMLDPVMRVKFGHECPRCSYKNEKTIKQDLKSLIKNENR